MGGTADLLFRIIGDSSEGEAALSQFRTSLASTAASSKAAAGSILYDWAGNPIKGLGADFGGMATAAEGAAARTVSSSGAARMAIRGLGTEMGVAMPRFVGSWLTSLGPVSAVMGAAFAPIAIIGLVEVLGKLPGAIHDGILAIEGFGAAQRKTFEEGVQQSLKRDEYLLDYATKLREISLIGKEGMDRLNQLVVINSANFSDSADLLVKYLDRIQQLKKITEYKPPTAGSGAGAELGAMDLTGQRAGGADKGPSLADIERAKTELADLEPRVAAMQKDLDALRLTDMSTSAEVKAESVRLRAEFEARWNESQQKAAAQVQQWEKAYIAQTAAEEEMAERDAETQTAIRERSAASAQAIVQNGQAAMENLKRFAEEDRENAARAKAAGDAELAQLGMRLGQIEKAHESAEDRIKRGYDDELARFAADEEKKSLALAVDEAQRTQIAQEYAAIRAALLTKENSDLQQLRNSQGWQGVFGNEFAQSIKRNEALSKEWADSSQRDHLMVRASLESLKETAEDTFGAMMKAEASAIMHAIVYKTSIKAAMEEAAKAVLESLAEQAAEKALFSAAEGFIDLAVGDFGGAAQAFEAAALFGTVAAGAGIAARAIPGGQSGAGASAAAGGYSKDSSGAGRSSSSGAAVGGTAANMGGTHISMVVYGHVYGTGGVTQLMADMNDAVMNSGATLTATNTKTGVQVTQ